MRKPYLIAIILTLTLCVWMLSGILMNTNNTDASTKRSSLEANATATPLFNVSVQNMRASLTPLFITANGQVEPNRVVQVRAQTEGQIEALGAKEGQNIQQNDTLARIMLDDRELRLAEQQALLLSRQRSYERLQKLAKQNYQSQNDIDIALANVEASHAAIARIALDIERTRITAPFKGVVEQMLVEQGDFVQVNTPVAVVIEQNPLVVTVPIAQQDISRIELDMSADITLSTGESVTGRVRYISPRANNQTRTFNVEIQIDNSQGLLRSGMSAKAKIATEEVQAHYISPALFSLSDSGEVGVKTVDESNVVRFNNVKILQSDSGGAWVSGLPDSARVIVSGQGFVAHGTAVRTSMATAG